MEQSNHVPATGATSLEETYHLPIHGNQPLVNWRPPAQLTFRSFREVSGSYDLHNGELIPHDWPLVLLSAAHAGDRGGSSISNTISFDIVAAPNSQQLASLSHVSEFDSSGLTTSCRSYASWCDSAEGSERSLQPFHELDHGFVDERKLYSCCAAAAGVLEFENALLESSIISTTPGELQLQVTAHDHDTEAVQVAAPTITRESDIPIYGGQDEEIGQTVTAKTVTDQFQDTSVSTSYPNKTVRRKFSLARLNNPPPNTSKELQDHARFESTRTLSSETKSEPLKSGLPDQAPAMAYSHDQYMSGQNSRRIVDVGGAAHKRNQKGKFKIQPGPYLQCEQQKRPVSPYGLPHGTSIFCAGSSGALNPSIRSKMTMDGVERAIKPRPKRKRTRVSGPDGLNQRMTHIAVERNRRKQMNDHLSALKALMPPSYLQKNDQASIIGVAVEFIKELQVLVECLESSKQRRRASEETPLEVGPSWPRFIHPGQMNFPSRVETMSSSRSIISTISKDIAHAPSFRRTMRRSELFSELPQNNLILSCTGLVKAESSSTAATVEVKILGNDAIVNVITSRRAQQLVKVIVALENIYLTILHTSVTTNKNTVLYTFNAKVGPECRMTVNQIADSLQQTIKHIDFTS